MGRRTVTSIRLDENLVQIASALGLNVSKITSETLKRAIMNLQPSKLNVIPLGIAGLSKNTRILMAETGKFQKADRLKAGDRVVSYDSMTEQCEDANVIDVGALTSIETLVSFFTITDNVGTTIELLPDTKLYCRRDWNSRGEWIRVMDVHPGYHIQSQSGPYRKGMLMGSTSIVEVTKEFPKDSLFYKLEVYPNNSFFANSNIERKLSWPSIGAAWGFPIKGYLGQIGSILEKSGI